MKSFFLRRTFGGFALLGLGLLLLCPGKSLGHSQNVSSLPSAVLFREFHRQLKPEKIVMILDEEPQESGRVRHLYLDLLGPRLGGVRVQRLALEAWDVQFNPVEEWTASGDEPVKVQEVLQTYAEGIITEKDLNDDLLQKKFGDDKKWHHLYLDFTPEGIYARGEYRMKLLVNLDILIEINGKLGIKKDREIWLEDYRFRVNKVNVPKRLTRSAVEELQPLLDLGKYMFPLQLKTLIMDDEKVALRSKVAPKSFKGIEYRQ